MKITLINPTAGDYQLSYAYKKLLPPVPLLGLCYIAAVLEKKGYAVSIIDQYAYRMSNRELLEEIKKSMPDIIGFSCLTPSMNNVQYLSGRIRDINRDVVIIAGNLHANLFADTILNEGIADMVISGEGEYTMLEAVSAVKSSSDLSQVRGISYFSEGRIVHNPVREQIENLDELPYPAWHLLKLEHYNKAPMLGLRYCPLPVLGSRGCPFRCAFCAQDKVHRGFRKRTIKNIADEIEYMYNRFGMKGFGFCDSFFPHSKESGYEFCEELRKRRLDTEVKWTTEMRVDQVDEKLIKTMKAAGLYLVIFGFESGSQDVLHAIKKTTTINQAQNAMRAIKKYGVLSLGLFMIGLPEDTFETCKQTIRFAKQLDCDIAKFNIFIPYPGTEIFEKYKNQIDPECGYEDFTSWNAWLSKRKRIPLVFNEIKVKNLIWLQQMAMLTYYARPKIIFRHLRLGTFGLPNIIFGGLFMVYGYVKTLIINFWINLNDKIFSSD